jgi:hypothetical protein
MVRKFVDLADLLNSSGSMQAPNIQSKQSYKHIASRPISATARTCSTDAALQWLEYLDEEWFLIVGGAEHHSEIELDDSVLELLRKASCQKSGPSDTTILLLSDISARPRPSE